MAMQHINQHAWYWLLSLAISLLLLSGIQPHALAAEQTTLSSASFNPLPAPRMVIIMDDLGNNARNDQRALALPGSITYGILPGTAFSKSLAQQLNGLHDSGKESIVHMPMASLGEHRLGPHGLHAEMSEQEFTQQLRDALASVPNAKGLSNHMGSALTQKPQPMRWLMATLKRHQLYFIDSRTTADTVAARVAREMDLPRLSRHVFLDHEPTAQAIDRAFQLGIRRAHRDGLVVMVAHPYTETLDYLEANLQQLSQHGVQLIPASEAISAIKSRKIALK